MALLFCIKEGELVYNTGQTAVFIKDLSGKEYPAIAVVNRKRRVNGQREISLSFFYTEINKDFMQKFIDDKGFRWQILFKNEWYTITHPGFTTNGDYFLVNVTAVLSFFVDMNGYYLQDKAENKSFTPAEYFLNLFKDTPYSFVLVDTLHSNTLSYQDNESKTQRFLYGVDRFEGEFSVKGKVAYLYELVGNDKDVILHEDLNINDVSIEVDASGFHTWAKGFGDLPEGDTDGNYKLKVEYRSPLIAKYGAIEGPAIKDGNFKDAKSLTAAVQKQVENSYKISTSISTADLTNNGYPEMVLDEGDRIWLYVNRLKLNQQVRVVEVDETFDWEGNIINANYIVGNEGIASRYKVQQYNTLKDFQEILSGKKRLEYNWLPDAVRRASEIINGNPDSLFKYLPGEIIGINQSNPNGYMRFNTDGIGFSRDGGKTYNTAMTYEGIVADAITTGTLYTALVAIMGRNNLIFMDGDQFKAIDANDPNKYTRIAPGEAYFAKGAGLKIERQDGAIWIQDGIQRNNLIVQPTHTPFLGDNVIVRNRYARTSVQTYEFYGAYDANHEGRYLKLEGYGLVGDAGLGVAMESYAGGVSFYQVKTVPLNTGSQEGQYFEMIIDLGVPSYTKMQFYVKMRSVEDGKEVGLRVNRIYQYG